MKQIIKNKEPDILTTYKNNAETPNYPHFCNKTNRKKQLKSSLLAEQGYLCCYCMGEISMDNMQVEHWRPQSNYAELDLNYQNLLYYFQFLMRFSKNY